MQKIDTKIPLRTCFGYAEAGHEMIRALVIECQTVLEGAGLD
jgi:hypothetical protein